MDVPREEYVADLKALARAIALQQAAVRCVVNAMLVKDEVVAEKERKEAYLRMQEAEAAVNDLAKRADVTSMLGDLGEDEWDILVDKLRSEAEPEDEEGEE